MLCYGPTTASLQLTDAVHCYYSHTCKKVSFCNWKSVCNMDLQNIEVRNSITKHGYGHGHGELTSNVSDTIDFMMDRKSSCNKWTTNGTMTRVCWARNYLTSHRLCCNGRNRWNMLDGRIGGNCCKSESAGCISICKRSSWGMIERWWPWHGFHHGRKMKLQQTNNKRDIMAKASQNHCKGTTSRWLMDSIQTFITMIAIVTKASIPAWVWPKRAHGFEGTMQLIYLLVPSKL